MYERKSGEIAAIPGVAKSIMDAILRTISNDGDPFTRSLAFSHVEFVHGVWHVECRYPLNDPERIQRQRPHLRPEDLYDSKAFMTILDRSAISGGWVEDVRHDSRYHLSHLRLVFDCRRQLAAKGQELPCIKRYHAERAAMGILDPLSREWLFTKPMFRELESAGILPVPFVDDRSWVGGVLRVIQDGSSERVWVEQAMNHHSYSGGNTLVKRFAYTDLASYVNAQLEANALRDRLAFEASAKIFGTPIG